MEQDVTHEEIDTMWQQAMQESIKDGEIFTRYHFAKMVAEKAAAKEREACAKLADEKLMDTALLMSMPPKSSAAWSIAAAIRARGQA